jgi:septum formation protein
MGADPDRENRRLGLHPGKMPLVLASASRARAGLLAAAGLRFDIVPAHIDEEEIKFALRNEGAAAGTVAENLADLKARRVSERRPGCLVIGADQILECEGEWFDKPTGLDQAREQLLALRGRTHRLHSFVCVSQEGARIWQHLEQAELTMRSFDKGFLDCYLEAVGEDVAETVGGYHFEGLGVNLFTRVRGNFHAILGLPLLPLLEFLRIHGVAAK